MTVWLTEEEKAFLDELAEKEDVTISKAIREGLQTYFEDVKDWIEEWQAEGRHEAS